MRKGCARSPETAGVDADQADYQLRANEQMVYTAFGTARIDAEGLPATCPPPTFPTL